MNNKFKRVVCACMALTMLASVSACSSKDNNSSSSAASTADSAADPDASSTYQRQTIETDPVSETLSGFDLSEYSSGDEDSIPKDFKFESEAEDGKCKVSASFSDSTFLGDYSGKGFVIMISKDDSVTFDIDFPAEGSYDVTLVSASDNGGAEATVTIDGDALTTFTAATTSFDNNAAERVLIGKGKHKIGIAPQTNAVYIDKIIITPSAQIDSADYDVNRQLCNPNATDETKRLYNFLCDSYGKYIISGQYAADNKGTESREFKEIYKNFEVYPAIMGLDLIELSPSRVAHGSSNGYDAIINAKDWYLNQNGIVTMCWHWNAPEPYIMKNGGQWWQGFYSEYTDIDLAKIMNGEDQEGYDMLVSDIDTIAQYLAELDDYHVPILWRPLHEGGGDPKWNNPWFWWGSSGADAYKQLWQLMYDRLTNYHKINNLIWVWNGQNVSYYPGDEYVDIMGYDVYADAGDYSSKKWYYDYTKSTTSAKKIVALTENGTLFDPDTAMNDGTRWCWFATWNGEFTLKDMQLSGEYTSLDMWKKIYTNDHVLTLGDLPDLKNYPMDTEKYLEEHPDEAPKSE